MIAALPNEDRLPNDRAVWREGPAPSCEGFRAVTVDYGGGTIESTFVDKAAWTHVVRWRFGWAPRA